MIRKELDRIKKEFGREKRTVVKMEKRQFMFAAPVKERRFICGGSFWIFPRQWIRQLIRNKENILKEYKFIVPCMNTDKICIFTNLGDAPGQVLDIPAGKFQG